MKNLKNLLEENAIPQELKQALTEAWEEALMEEKNEIRKELAERYEHDKALLIESLDKFVTEALEKEATVFRTRLDEMKKQYNTNLKIMEQKLEAAKNLYEQALAEELKELKKEKRRLAEERAHVQKVLAEAHENALKEAESKLEQVAALVENTMQKELEDLISEKKKLTEARLKYKQRLAETRAELKEQMKNSFFKLQDFVLKELNEKLSDVVEQRKLLEKRRIELEVKAQKQLTEAKRQLVERSSDRLYETVNSVLESELKQFREDLKYARENNFGRRIFEAFAAEFMASYLAEGSRVKEMMKQLEQLNENMAHLQAQLAEKEKALKEARKKEAKLMESLEREKILHRLLSPLGNKHRKIMENILRDVKTSKLEETYNRYLPELLKEDTTTPENTKMLTESTENNEAFVSITGDKKEKIEMQPAEQNDVMEIETIRKLAGLK